MTIYDEIGHDYAKTRLADDRITARLRALLNLPPYSTVLDVGAATDKSEPRHHSDQQVGLYFVARYEKEIS